MWVTGGFSASHGSWDDNIDMLYRAYETARDAGEKIGFKVLFGMEIALNNPYRDYLVYGPDPEFLKAHNKIQNSQPKRALSSGGRFGRIAYSCAPF